MNALGFPSIWTFLAMRYNNTMNTRSNLFLVGLMGAGKTTIGRLLARHRSLSFIDSDQEIEARTGVRIGTIFELEGGKGFRGREETLIGEYER